MTEDSFKTLLLNLTAFVDTGIEKPSTVGRSVRRDAGKVTAATRRKTRYIFISIHFSDVNIVCSV